MELSVILGIVILAILVLVVFIEIRRFSDKKRATEFIEGIGDKILEVILRTINESKPDMFDNLVDFEAFLIEAIYNNVWDFVADKANESEEVDLITKSVFKFIDKESVIRFINRILNKRGLYDTMANKYGSYSITNIMENEEDQKLQEEYSDSENYVEDSSLVKLEDAKVVEPSEEEKANLNPSKDEEEEFDINDDSMELIVEDEPEIISTKDKNGNTLYYEIGKDGKKKRVSKEYALANMEK